MLVYGMVVHNLYLVYSKLTIVVGTFGVGLPTTLSLGFVDLCYLALDLFVFPQVFTQNCMKHKLSKQVHSATQVQSSEFTETY